MEIHNQKKPPSGNFFIIPNCIFKERLKARDLAVYCYLMYCADRVTFDCYPARKTIADACGMSPPTVDEATKVLVDKGLINVSHRYDLNGNRTSHMYTINKIW
ncbi:MAG: helix-turn-helix domain-containing protein [Eubacterium sp.]|nr:helix-turn-helix domain-containing protein [Eubacterium sp.]